jgi:RNA polymerase sigma-70 factor (ECF subfamily)
VVPAKERLVSTAGTRTVLYCVVPSDLAHELHEPLREFFRDQPGLSVVVDWRVRDRRCEERRTEEGVPPGPERRRIRSATGRRISERRAPTLEVDPPALPPIAEPHIDRLTFVELLEPATQHAEDIDSARLVLSAQAGDSSAFSSLYLRYFDRLYGYLRLAVKDPHEAEDIAQEAFLSMLRALPQYDVRLTQPFRVLLFHIARNRSIDHFRKQRGVEVEAPAELDQLRDSGLADDPAGAFDSLSDSELARYLRRLPATQRQTLVLRYALDFSTEEIASVMEITPQAVRNLQHRGLEFLRRRLKDNDDDKLAGGRRMAAVVMLRPAPVITGRQDALRAPLVAGMGSRFRN